MKPSRWFRFSLLLPGLSLGLVLVICLANSVNTGAKTLIAPSFADSPSTITFHSNASSAIEYSIQVFTDGPGTVNLDPPGGVYDGGASVTLTANAEPGWSFTGWSGDLAGSQNPVSLVVEGDITVTATFLETKDKHDPFADTYSDDASPEQAHGLDDYLYLRAENGSQNTPTCSPSTYLWLKFAVPYTSKTIPAVTLSLPSEPDSDANTMELNLYGSQDVSWDEAILNWTNQPETGLELITQGWGAPPGSDTLFFGPALENYVNTHKGGLVSFLIKADCEGSVAETAERVVRARQHVAGSGVELYYDYPSSVTLEGLIARPSGNNPELLPWLGLLLAIVVVCTSVFRSAE